MSPVLHGLLLFGWLLGMGWLWFSILDNPPAPLYPKGK